MRWIPRYFCSTKSSKRPSMALINHTINQNSIQLSAQTLSKISASLIIKFRQRLSLLVRGQGAAWHWDEGQVGIATPGAWEGLHQPSPPTPQHPSTATSSRVGIAAHGNTSHCFPLSALSTTLLYFFKVILSCFSLSVLFLLFLLYFSFFYFSSFPPIPSLFTITCLLSHHPFLALSLFFPSRPPHQSKEAITQRKNKSWTCANTMGQEATYGTSKSQSHEGC